MNKLPPVKPAPSRAAGVGFSIGDPVGRFIPVTPGDPFAGANPAFDSEALVSYDWTSLGAKAVIWDTVSEFSQQLLVAKSTDNAKAHEWGGYSHPAQLDYNITGQVLGLRLRRLLQQPIHVICLSHTDDKSESVRDEKGQMTSHTVAQGFGCVGSKMITKVENIFKPAMIYAACQRAGKPQFKAMFQPKGKIRAKWAVTGVDPPGGMMGLDVTGPDKCRDMWEMLLDAWNGPLRLGIHGFSGDGKTTLATSIADVLDGPVVYIGYDPGCLSQIGAWPHLLSSKGK